MQINICYFFMYLFEALIIYYYCSCLFEKKCSRTITISSISICYFVEFLLSYFHNPLINTCLFIIFSFLIIAFLYKCRILNSLFHSLVLTAAMTGTELLIVPLFTNDFWKEQSLFHNRIIQAPLCKLSYFIVVNILIQFFKCRQLENKYTSIANSVLIIIAFLTYFILYSIISLFIENPYDIKQRTVMIIDAFFILLINILASWIYTFTLKKSGESTELKYMLIKEKDYCRYYQALIKEDEQHNILIHDIKKHLQSIMLLNNDQDYNKVSEYIGHLLDDYELLTPVNICDNKMLNSLCNRYRDLFRNNNINFHTDIRKKCLLDIPENELTSLICNLLDNAFEACIGIPNAFIELNIYKKLGFTYINVINSCIKNPIDSSSRKLISTKKYNSNSGIMHGMGLKSVEQILMQHNGSLEFHYDEDMNEFHITLSLQEYIIFHK